MSKECLLVGGCIHNLTQYMADKWKYGLERLYNAIVFLLPSNEDIFSSLIHYSFDRAKFIFVNTADRPDFRSDVLRSVERFGENLYEYLGLTFAMPVKQYFSTVGEAGAVSADTNDEVEAEADVEKIKEYVNKHFGENITLEMLAEHISLSPTYVGAWFKKHTGESFSNYLTNVRMEMALKYLRDSDISIIAISRLVGYKNTSHFYHLITQYANMKPSEYREKWQKR